MGKIIVSQFVTLHGVMEDPGGSEGTPYGGEPASLQLVSAQPMGEILTLIYQPKQDY